MFQTLLGRDGFRRGMDLYFDRHDGQAVTCDDFRAAMADANHLLYLVRANQLFVPGGGDDPEAALKAIDEKVPSVTVLTEDGRTVSLKVEDKKRLEGVKVGDKVEITYTVAVMISVK